MREVPLCLTSHAIAMTSRGKVLREPHSRLQASGVYRGDSRIRTHPAPLVALGSYNQPPRGTLVRCVSLRLARHPCSESIQLGTASLIETECLLSQYKASVVDVPRTSHPGGPLQQKHSFSSKQSPTGDTRE